MIGGTYGLRTLKFRTFFARNDDLDRIKDRSDFVMINNFTNEMKYRDGEIEGTIDLNQYFYKNRSQAVSFIMMEYKNIINKSNNLDLEMVLTLSYVNCMFLCVQHFI